MGVSENEITLVHILYNKFKRPTPKRCDEQ